MRSARCPLTLASKLSGQNQNIAVSQPLRGRHTFTNARPKRPRSIYIKVEDYWRRSSKRDEGKDAQPCHKSIAKSVQGIEV